MKMSNGQKLKSILKSILNKDIDQAEVYFSSSKTLKIDVLNQKVESIDKIRGQGLGIRIIKDKRLGFAYTSDFDESMLEDTINHAIENAKNSAADEFHSFPYKQKNRRTEEQKNQKTKKPKNQLNLYDQAINEIPIGKKVELALKAEESAYKSDKKVKKTEKVSYVDSEIEMQVANSNGINVNYKTNFCGADAQVIAVKNGEMEYGLGISFVKKFKDLEPISIGQEAAERAGQLLGAKPIRSQKLPLVIDPVVGAELIAVIASALSADAVQKGKSLFVNRINKIVAAKVVNLIDNGQLKNGLASAPFDAEGVATQENKLIEAGKLTTYLFNTYTANKGKTNSTGNAARGSFKTVPGIGTTNLYLKPGKEKPEAIIKSVKKGLYVTRVMGLHTANPITGDFSVGASGIMIENGKKTQAVRGITIAGNLIEMLKAIEVVGSDLRFIVDVGSPTLLISGITVAGSQ